MHRLAQQLPALLDLVGGHVMQAGVVRVLLMGLPEPRIQFDENRILRPGLTGRPGLGELGEPQFQSLVPRVAAQQSMVAEQPEIARARHRLVVSVRPGKQGFGGSLRVIGSA